MSKLLGYEHTGEAILYKDVEGWHVIRAERQFTNRSLETRAMAALKKLELSYTEALLIDQVYDYGCCDEHGGAGQSITIYDLMANPE